MAAEWLKWLQKMLNPMYAPTDRSEGRLLTCFERSLEVSKGEKRRIRNHLANKTWFNTTATALVIINAVFVGIQADIAKTNVVEDNPILFGVDCVFFLLFFSEMVIRMSQYYWEYFVDTWNLFDFFVISLTLFDIMSAVVTGESGAFKMALAVRILRVCRIVRYIRGMKMFYRLWMTIKGLVDAMKTMLWVALMLVIIVYCAAIALLTVLQDKDADEGWLEREVYFGTVFRTMWTVMQLISFDSWASKIMRPMLPISWIAAGILFLMIIVGSFGVVNVIVAVMVESARANSEENKAYAAKIMEKMDQDILLSLGQSFKVADEDDSGELDQDEFMKFIQKPAVALKMRLLGINMDEAGELFEVIDADGSGVITPEEYVNGLKKLRGQARGQDLVSLISFSQRQCSKAKHSVDRIKLLNQQADKLLVRMRLVGKQMTEELRDRRHIEQRTMKMWTTTRRRQEVLAHIDQAKEGFYPAINQ
jgi:voltage-gated sodium channel